MDGSRFDRLTRQLATGQSRRSVLKGLLGFSGSALVGSTLTDETDARRSSSGGTSTTAEPVSVCAADSFECGGECCSLDQSCCNDGCCDGSCTVGGSCCPTGNTTCGADCCSPEQECCDGECCNGVCYGEELCCPSPRLFNFDAWVCCPEGTRPCGLLCIPNGTCCSDDECTDFSVPCNTGRCSEPGGFCFSEPLPDRTEWDPGVSVCMRGEICTQTPCGCTGSGDVCGFEAPDGCEGTRTCLGCNDETGCIENEQCCSGVCVSGTCLFGPVDTNGACDDDADCLTNRCHQNLCCEPKTTCTEEVDCGPDADDGCGGTIPCQRCIDAPCTTDSECYTGSCNGGSCEVPVPTGDPCDSVEDCASNTAVCEGGFCLETISGPCQTVADCSGALVCDPVDSTCRVEIGGACTQIDDCTTGYACGSDNTCGLPLDAECLRDTECNPGLVCYCLDAKVEVCESGCDNTLYCDPPGICKIPPGGACTTTSECPEQYACDGICVFVPSPVGGPCRADSACEAGLVCVCPDGSGFCTTGGVCKVPQLGECSDTSDCTDGLICNTFQSSGGETSLCQLPVGGSCDASLEPPFLGLQCESFACGETFFRPSVENPVCCQSEGQACSSDEECCKITRTLPNGVTRFAPTRCKSDGTCGIVLPSGQCTTSQDCPPSRYCNQTTGLCDEPPTPVSAGGECDRTGQDEYRICGAGLICIDCRASDDAPANYRCADAEAPCCGGGPDLVNFWCGETADPYGGFINNLCCAGRKCERYDDDQNCGACGNDCTADPDNACAVSGSGQCAFRGGEAVQCYWDSVCEGGVSGDASRTECDYGSAWISCAFFGGSECSVGGGCDSCIPDYPAICVTPPDYSVETCNPGQECDADSDCGSSGGGGRCVNPCTNGYDFWCGIGNPNRCVCD